MKTKTNIKNIIIVIILTVVALTFVCLFNRHQDEQREHYAKEHNCTWVIYGSHDICR